MTHDELRAAVVGLREEIDGLAEIEDITAEDDARLTEALAEFDTRNAELAAVEERSARVAAVRANTTEVTAGHDPGPGMIVRNDPFEGDLRTATRGELRDRAMQVIDEDKTLAPFQKDQADLLLRSYNGDLDGSIIARRLLATENEAYRSGFQKAVTQATPAFSPEEAHALNEFRAGPMADGTNSLGGYGIPVLIDPSIILTSGAADAPILRLARTVQITTNAWKGVTAAGVSWSFDAEGSAVSDDSPTLAQPAVSVYAARGFIPFTYEVEQDYPGFASEMNMLLSQGYVDLIASQTMTGSGSSNPRGVFIAMNAITTNPTHVTVTTAGTIGAVDVRAAYAALPERYRSRSTWVAHQSVVNKFSGFGNGNALSDYTVNLQTDGTPTLMGRPVVVSDYAPSFVGTTGSESFAVIGDFSNFLIVQRAGMSVELIPQLFDQASGRPNGTRGWFAFSRVGHDVINSNGLRLLSNS